MIQEIIQTKEGIWIPKNDTHIGVWAAQQGRIDTDRTIDRLLEFIPVGGVVVDAGASIGDHTVPYARKAGMDGKVYAFEPNPTTFRCLAENTKGLQVIKMNCGLSDEHGELQYAPDNANFGASKVSNDGAEKIKVIRLDDVPEHFSALHFFKIDVEGMEPKVLSGASGLIDKYRPVIYCEINDGALASLGFNRQSVFDFMSKHNYSVEAFTGDFKCTQFDILCRPK
jgi:FkbM family methyltransferase